MKGIDRSIIFIMDDVRYDQFFKLLKEGFLPNIKKYVYDNSINSKCISIFPGITVPAQLAVQTGTYTDEFSVPGMHWWDRKDDIVRTYASLAGWELTQTLDKHIKTLYEQIDGNSLNLFCQVYRGSTYNYPTVRGVILLYLWYFYIKRENINRGQEFIMRKILDAFNNPKKFFKNKEEPRVVLSWGFPTDDTMHNFGYDSEEYHRALKLLDIWFGHLIEGWNKYKGLKELGFLDETVFVFTSDHGNYKAKKVVDLVPFIENIGLKPIPVNLNLRKGKDRGKGLGDFDLAIGSLGQWYFRSKIHGERPNLNELKSFSEKDINLIDQLMNIQDTQILYYREDENTKDKGVIQILRKKNSKIIEGAIEYNKDKVKLIQEDGDLFEYQKFDSASKLIDGKYHDINEWLIGTHETDFPIICDQVARLFRNPNSCDILTSTLGNAVYNYEHGFTKNDHLYSHDLSRATKVPLVIGGSNFNATELEVTKISDLLPTIVKMLGGKIDKLVVGSPLV
ncbi:MAG: hypothetical protein EAX96_00590 [Candidatus Lokiarchaeota archaeon]|nr:hypothetical protein [Candidatus Lokiarchaeota archaeon]